MYSAILRKYTNKYKYYTTYNLSLNIKLKQYVKWQFKGHKVLGFNFGQNSRADRESKLWKTYHIDRGTIPFCLHINPEGSKYVSVGWPR
jgi:hypothetical protein